MNQQIPSPTNAAAQPTQLQGSPQLIGSTPLPMDGKLNPVLHSNPSQSPLTQEEVAECARLVELIIAAGSQAIIGNQALKEIRQKGLWRATHKSFEAFCKDALGISEQRASQLISAAEEYLSLKGEVAEELLPTNESALRSLRKVAPAKKTEVLQLAAQLSAFQRPTGPAIKQAWEQLRGEETTPTTGTTGKKVKPNRILKIAQTMAQMIEELSPDTCTIGEINELKARMAKIQSVAMAKLPQ